MTLETLQNEMIAALKAKDKTRREVLSGLVGAVKKAGIDNGCRDNIPESLVDTTLLKEQKTVREMIDTCPADRAETLAAYKEKMAIVNEFAPHLMTDPVEIKAAILQILKEQNTSTDNKALMKIIMSQLKGKADMKIANQIVREVLA